jgi:hypothetical protein
MEVTMNNLDEIYVNVDDFMKNFIDEWNKMLISSGEKQRLRNPKLSPSEIITIVILFHQSNYRTFKHFYLNFVSQYLKEEFPGLVSYSRFVRLQQSILVPLCSYLQSRRGQSTGISYIDSTTITVCHNRRINQHKVFKGIAARGKSTMGWFYGFKLHIVSNEHGELLSFCVTPGNCDDRKPLGKLTKGLTGKLFGDRGYISKKWFDKLMIDSLQLITSVKSNMKNKLLPIMDKILLRKRFIIETINDQLKNISQIEHSRHRSVANFMVNIIAGLIAYTYQDKKPAINFNRNINAII